jgi:hypothetical protein
MRRTMQAIAVLGLCLMLAACAHQPPPNHDATAGFFVGLIQGVLAPIDLILGIFLPVRVYQFPNTGWLYDFGFMLGISAWGGGGAAAAQR